MATTGYAKGEEVDIEEALVTQREKPWYIVNGFNVLWIVVLVLLIFPIATLAVVVKNKNKNSAADTAADTISDDNVINKCLDDNLVTPNYKTEETTPYGDSLLITHATIWNGLTTILTDADILLVAGKISQISPTSGSRIVPPEDVTVYDATNLHVTPGIVDLHSHLGVYPFPDLAGGQDGNEATGPTFPQVRSLDAFNPNDEAINLTRSGGVTTAHILPGSANLMGGEATVVKFRGQNVQDMLLTNAPRTLKFACGENPKRVYGSRQQTPASRMGNGWMIRKMFEDTRKLMATQKAWCSTSKPTTPFPRDLALDPLVALVRGKALLHNHCYTVCDLEMMIRIAAEFGFVITAFHHALESYKIASIMAEENITSAIFVDNWGFKLEGYEASAYAAKTLHDAGAPLVIKSDHPVVYSKYLIHEGQKAVHYDLPPVAALAALTSTPARALGLDGRIGSLQVGLDADVVVWDRDPLTLGATPVRIYIDGVLMVQNNIPPALRPSSFTTYPVVTESGTGAAVCPSNGNAISLPACYAVSGASVYNMNGSDATAGANIVVENGTITCATAGDTCIIPTDCHVFSVQGGVVIPGIIDAAAHVGQDEISQESSTQDGSISGSGSSGSSLLVHAVDGIRIASRKVRSAWAGGVTGVVTRPQGSQMVQGLSASFHTCCGEVVDDVLLKTDTAVHLVLGNLAKAEGLSASYSGQFALLRNLFNQAKAQLNATGSSLQPLIDALNGRLPVVVEVDSVDVINSLLRLQQDFTFPLVLLGGAEAHLVAAKLAAANAGVIYRNRPEPDTFEKFRNEDNAVATLVSAGVRVAVTLDAAEYTRNLRWEAGFAREFGLSNLTAISLITSNVASLYNLGSGAGQIVPGTPANFVLFNGDPLSTLTHVQLVAQGSWVECLPRQA